MITKRDDSGNVERFEIYEAGTSVTVQDGHLLVLGSAAGEPAATIAIYAPGSWLWASQI